MASNKNALIRYKTIDQCLRNKMKRWTLDDLIEACSDALYEYEGKDVYVSKRTVQLDIQSMRSDKLGYNAPIEVYDRKFYRYSEEEYSIMNIPVTDNDVQIMNEAIQVLRQFKDFSLFKEMDGVLQRLEDSVYASQKTNRAIIHLDKNEQLKGLKYIDPIYAAIQNKKVVTITYQSFKARKASNMTVHPQLLKEYNNRWFLLASHKKQYITLALDRISNIVQEENQEYNDLQIDGDTYYRDVIGATVANTRAQRIEFWIDKENAPYVITKPFHRSQRLIKRTDDGVVFNILVQVNYELERKILGFGNSIEILKPARLRQRMIDKLHKAIENYTS
ncbi:MULTISPECIES: helix-turn-helix transcriptional regulator [unclassified Tenacibaculum]|uniref:helix-turn-helix transcriptional regulator n=1 Tax=unclassified Tenacibaculum TaxID=2635139 RepID=UPI001F41DCA8|nr:MULTISPECIES: WYL domain-containing protein [unclassified Tenacibaculum]MCF2875735.1 WYL domain-containing protein [Tenacibaculum sp. Cn5-1]MCF2935811.1 WYL domain-containing protein [Tenacibaculum sp. Cn5-34]MCG7512371.1 WYL domain-containing protein [Tenacibaculum sp. Cn5-46]